MSPEESREKKHHVSASFDRPVSQREWIQRHDALVKENEELRQAIEDYKRDAAVYMSAIDDADDMAKASVQKQMAELRAENSRLNRRLADAYVTIGKQVKENERLREENLDMKARLAEAIEDLEKSTLNPLSGPGCWTHLSG